MRYHKLTEIFRDYERQDPPPNKALTGYITFTESSFEKPYHKESRTYITTSKEKAFMPNMGGYSIFGTSVDGTDRGVRLEQYMKAERDPDGWEVEDCGTVNYLLVRSMIGRQSFRSFAYKKDAMRLMSKEFFSLVGVAEMDDMSIEKAAMERYEHESHYIDRNGALFNGYERISWEILTLYNNGTIIQTADQFFDTDNI